MLIKEHQLIERRTCSLAGANRSTVRYKSNKDKKELFSKRSKRIALQNRRYRYSRISKVIRKQIWEVNHKAVYRIYQNLGLKVRKRRSRKHATGDLIIHPHQCWALDFVHDSLSNGRRLRVLTIIDHYRRECLRVDVEYGARPIRL